MASVVSGSTFEDDSTFNEDAAYEPVGLSRRTFFAGAAATAASMGFMALLPRVPGGYLSPIFGPDVAYADPNDARFVLTVVGADETGFQVVDVATLDERGNGTPVPRAKIKVISRADNTKYVEGEVDEEGKIIFNIDSLALRDDNGNPLQDVFQFNATVQVDGSKCRPVMRDFTASLVHVEGASGYIIAVHVMEDDDDDYGYIERFGFDDWDILYTKNTFFRSAENDIDHWITVRVVDLPEAITDKLLTPLTAKFTEKLKKDGKYTGETKEREYSYLPSDYKYDADKKMYTCMFTSKFLQQGFDGCFNGDEVELTFSYPVGKKKRKVTTTLYTEEAPLQGSVYKSPLTPFLTGNSVLGSISSSNDWPVFNNADISIINWSWPIKLFLTPKTFMLSLGTQILVTGDNGTVKDWKDSNQDSLKQRYERARDNYSDGIKSLGKAKPFKDDNNRDVSHKWAGKFSINIVMGMVLGMQFDSFKGQGENVSKYFEGQACAGVGLDLKGSVSFKFAIASIPFFITISAGLELVFAGTFVITEEIIGDQVLNANDITWVPNGSMSINIKPSFKLSVGVGIDGVASVSISGCIALPMYIGWLEPKPDPDADDTHFTVGYTFKAELSAQLVCFSGSVSIWSKAENPFYDNWNKSPVPPLPTVNDVRLWGEDAGARFLHTLPDGSVGHTTVMTDDGRLLASNGGDMLADMLAVTMEDMGATFEAEATRGAQVANSADEVLPDLHRNMIPMVVELEDGSLVTQFVPCEGVNAFTFADELTESVMGLAPTDAQEGAPSDTSEPEAEPLSDDTAPEGEPAPEQDTGTPADEPTTDEDTDIPAEEPTTDTPEDAVNGAVPFAVAIGAVDVAYADELPPDPENEYDAYLLGDPFLGFGASSTAEYEYDNVAGKTTGAVCGSGGVKGIGLYDGIKPNVDVVIYNEVFSDPRQRIVNINGAPYLFRIMTVDYSFKGEPVRRPRVVCSKFDVNSRTWGDPKVIEYGTGTNKIKRIDMFDYDFDIVVRSAGTSWTRHVEACLVVTGGMRPQGDGTSIYEAFTTPTVAVVFLDENLDVFQRTVKQATDLYDDGLSHMVYNPRVCDGFAAGGASGAVAFAFLHRAADNPEEIMSADVTKVSFGMGYCYLRDGVFAMALKAGSIIDPDSDTPIYVDPLDLDKSIISMDLIVGESVKGKYDARATLLFYKTQGYEVCSAIIPEGASFAGIKMYRNITSSATLPQIAAWPGHGTVLFTKHRDPDGDSKASDYYLYAAAFDPQKENQPGFEDSYERVDFNGFKGGSFAVSPTGKYLFYYESFNGNPGDDVNPETGEHTAVHEEVYRIMASRYVNGTFSEDFPFAELDSPVDDFEVMNITDDASTFLATEITDADRSVGRLRYIAVPNTLSAEIEGFREIDPFVCAGKRCVFQADIRNHGNLIIGGFDVCMYDADGGMAMVGEPFQVQTIDPKQVLHTSSSRRAWMDDVEVSPEEAYASLELEAQDEGSEVELLAAEDEVPISEIMPGELLSYPVEFDIPSGWSGKRNVVLRVTNVWSPGVQIAYSEPLTIEAGTPIKATLNSSEGPIALHLHEGATGTLELDTAEATAKLNDPLEEVEEDDNPKPTPDPNPKPTPFPNTGDELSGGFMAPVGLAIGGLGALLGAYSLRRMQNERDDDIIDIDDFEVSDE